MVSCCTTTRTRASPTPSCCPKTYPSDPLTRLPPRRSHAPGPPTPQAPTGAVTTGSGPALRWVSHGSFNCCGLFSSPLGRSVPVARITTWIVPLPQQGSSRYHLDCPFTSTREFPLPPGLSLYLNKGVPVNTWIVSLPQQGSSCYHRDCTFTSSREFPLPPRLSLYLSKGVPVTTWIVSFPQQGSSRYHLDCPFTSREFPLPGHIVYLREALTGHSPDLRGTSVATCAFP